jgi:hypothetical protein
VYPAQDFAKPKPARLNLNLQDLLAALSKNSLMENYKDAY